MLATIYHRRCAGHCRHRGFHDLISFLHGLCIIGTDDPHLPEGAFEDGEVREFVQIIQLIGGRGWGASSALCPFAPDLARSESALKAIMCRCLETP